jgi:hypothetical protein
MYKGVITVMYAALLSFATGRLVGLPAPDFEAEAVSGQEFIKLKLSDYRCFALDVARAIAVIRIVVM